MTIGYIITRGAMEKDAGSIAVHGAFGTAQRLYEQVSGWTGLDVGQILDGDLPEDHGKRNAVLAIRSITAQLAVADVLAEGGAAPTAVASLSLGITSASGMVGALDRKALFEMLWYRRDIPELSADAPAQGVATCHVPPGQDVSDYVGGRNGVYVGIDFGPAADGSGRWLMLAGYRAALDELAAQAPDAVVVIQRGTAAVHSPLRQHAADFVRDHVAGLEFRPPNVPFYACLDPWALTTGDDVREAVWRNLVRPARIPLGLDGLLRHGVTLGLLVGPSMADDLIAFPFPTLHVQTPEDIEKVLAAAASGA